MCEVYGEQQNLAKKSGEGRKDEFQAYLVRKVKKIIGWGQEMSKSPILEMRSRRVVDFTNGRAALYSCRSE